MILVVKMEKKITILQVGYTCNIGGIETYLMSQYRNMPLGEIQYIFLANREDGEAAFSDEIKELGGEIIYVTARRKNPLRHYYEIFKYIKTHRGELNAIILNALTLTYIYPLLVGWLFSVPIRVIQSHNTNFEKKPDILRKIVSCCNEKLLTVVSTDYWACSKSAGDWMFGEGHPFKILNSPIDLSKFHYSCSARSNKRRELGLENAFIIGHVGRFSRQKNHLFIIDVFKKIVKEKKEAVLLLIGGYNGAHGIHYYQETVRAVKESDLEEKVKFLGMRCDVKDLLQAMDCFVMPSLFEGLPAAGIEAQAVGLPCLFSDTITKELKVIDSVRFLPIDGVRGVTMWADTILNIKEINRETDIEAFTRRGLNAHVEAQKLLSYYKERVDTDGVKA